MISGNKVLPYSAYGLSETESPGRRPIQWSDRLRSVRLVDTRPWLYRALIELIGQTPTPIFIGLGSFCPQIRDNRTEMYIYNPTKPKKRIHHVNPETGNSVCLVENGISKKTQLTTSETIPHGRKLCSTCEHLLKMGKTSKSKNNFNPKYFYSSRQWHKLRYQAFQKYGRRCMVCGGDYSEGVRLHVDHIKPLRDFPESAFDITNLQILCALCNSGKGSWDDTDWRDHSKLEQELEVEEYLTGEQEAHIREILQ